MFDVTFIHKILNGVIDCLELLRKNGLKVSYFNSKFHSSFVIPRSKNNYFTNRQVCHLPTTCNKIPNFDFFFNSTLS